MYKIKHYANVIVFYYKIKIFLKKKLITTSYQLYYLVEHMRIELMTS